MILNRPLINYLILKNKHYLEMFFREAYYHHYVFIGKDTIIVFFDFTSQGLGRVLRTLDYLLTESGYNKRFRPSFGGQPIPVGWKPIRTLFYRVNQKE